MLPTAQGSYRLLPQHRATPHPSKSREDLSAIRFRDSDRLFNFIPVGRDPPVPLCVPSPLVPTLSGDCDHLGSSLIVDLMLSYSPRLSLVLANVNHAPEQFGQPILEDAPRTPAVSFTLSAGSTIPHCVTFFGCADRALAVVLARTTRMFGVSGTC